MKEGERLEGGLSYLVIYDAGNATTALDTGEGITRNLKNPSRLIAWEGW